MVISAWVSAGSQAAEPKTDGLSKALTFHASFDHGVDADFARGERALMHSVTLEKRFEPQKGLPASREIQIAKGAGRFGDALRFTRKQAPVVFFPAAKNVAYSQTNWGGTVSFWLSVDPREDLEMSFCDPIQITPRAWNDAAFFVEFEKRAQDTPFRIGAYSDIPVWNPNNRKWEEMSATEKPHLPAPTPIPFSRGKWTHVAFTWDHFNTGKRDGVVHLYLDGKKVVTIPERQQTFTWDLSKTLILMGIGYVGLWDELALFDRALTAEEVHQVTNLPKGIASLHR